MTNIQPCQILCHHYGKCVMWVMHFTFAWEFFAYHCNSNRLVFMKPPNRTIKFISQSLHHWHIWKIYTKIITTNIITHENFQLSCFQKSAKFYTLENFCVYGIKESHRLNDCYVYTFPRGSQSIATILLLATNLCFNKVKKINRPNSCRTVLKIDSTVI